MIVRMKVGAASEDVDYLVRRATSLGLKTHVSEQSGQTVVGLLGDTHGISTSALSGLRGVEDVLQTTQSFRLGSREFRDEPTVVEAAGQQIGPGPVAVMAGPCSVETPEQILDAARAVQQAGAGFLRGGAFKPRSSPYSFQGHAEDGLKMLAEAREATGLGIITEVMSSEQVPLVARYADILQIGTRNMQNYALLHAVGETSTPVLLKRGMMSTIKELLLSAEYILSHGNPNVILCERGIRTFETYTRNTLDINAVPALKELSHLPVVVDPSHATGKASLVRSVTRAAVAAGADGLLIEVHPTPERAWSDADQTLSLAEFSEVMQDVRTLSAAIGRAC